MLGYLGPNGTFSHQAAMEWSEGKEEIKEFSTIYSVILAVEKGEIDRAIVPIENSIDGSINTTLDTLAFDVDLYITGEYFLHISENLMVKKTEKLYMELSALENRGVTIWLEGTPSDSLNVSNQLSIHEDTSYMRDYVFEEGRLKEVHFDKVSK